jgi:hypothetical protein
MQGNKQKVYPRAIGCARCWRNLISFIQTIVMFVSGNTNSCRGNPDPYIRKPKSGSPKLAFVFGPDVHIWKHEV